MFCKVHIIDNNDDNNDKNIKMMYEIASSPLYTEIK